MDVVQWRQARLSMYDPAVVLYGRQKGLGSKSTKPVVPLGQTGYAIIVVNHCALFKDSAIPRSGGVLGLPRIHFNPWPFEFKPGYTLKHCKAKAAGPYSQVASSPPTRSIVPMPCTLCTLD